MLKAYDQLKTYPKHQGILIITQKYVSNEDKKYAKEQKVILIDRKMLKAIIKRRVYLSDFLM